MALISCPECNKEVSDKVEICPHCGYPFCMHKNKKKAKKTLAIILLSSILVITLAIAGIFISKAIERNDIREINNLLQSSITNSDYETLQQELLNIQTAGYSPDRVYTHYSYALDTISAKVIENLSADNFDAALLAMDSYVKIADSRLIPSLEYDLSFSEIDTAFYEFAQKSFNNKDYSLALQAASICGESNSNKVKILVVSELGKDGQMVSQTYERLIGNIEEYINNFAAVVFSLGGLGGDFITLAPKIAEINSKIKSNRTEFVNYINNLKNKYPIGFLPEWAVDYYNASIALAESGKKYSVGFPGNFLMPAGETEQLQSVYGQVLVDAEEYNKALKNLQDYLKVNFGS